MYHPLSSNIFLCLVLGQVNRDHLGFQNSHVRQVVTSHFYVKIGQIIRDIK